MNTRHPIAVYTFEGSCNKNYYGLLSATGKRGVVVYIKCTHAGRSLQCKGGREICESWRSKQPACPQAYSAGVPEQNVFMLDLNKKCRQVGFT